MYFIATVSIQGAVRARLTMRKVEDHRVGISNPDREWSVLCTFFRDVPSFGRRTYEADGHFHRPEPVADDVKCIPHR